MGPQATFIVALAKVLVWPVALFFLIYLKGEALLALFQRHTIRVKRKGFTLEILPPISELPKERELFKEVSPQTGKRPRSKSP